LKVFLIPYLEGHVARTLRSTHNPICTCVARTRRSC
jgi:hypothetical protein